MSNADFEQLMRSRALGALLPGEGERLTRLSASDPERARRAAAQATVLEALARERELADAIARPAEPREDADETMQRLTEVAATAEQDLRARLRHGCRVRGTSPSPPSSWRRPLGLACLAAAAALLLWFGFGRGDGIASTPPEDLRSGARLQLVLFNPTLTAEARKISWAAVVGASGYDVDILDREGAVVLHRGDELLKSTEWELTPDQYADLLPLRPLRLRVTALDGVGLPIGSSGDLGLGLR